jgi:hypothetical protein
VVRATTFLRSRPVWISAKTRANSTIADLIEPAMEMPKER